MNKLKIATRILLGIIILLIIASFALGGYVCLIGIALLYILLYYIMTYVLLLLFSKYKIEVYKYIGLFLIVIPIVWGLIDFEGLIEFLV